MVISILISFFFSVNDSVVLFKKPGIKVLSFTDTSVSVLYRGKIEEYETGNYYYPKFIIKEINVKKRRKSVIVNVSLRKKRSFTVAGNKLIFYPPKPKFFIKLSHASPYEIKVLLRAANFKVTWLDSLKGKDYTIYGIYTEDDLKEELLKYDRREKTHKVKKRQGNRRSTRRAR